MCREVGKEEKEQGYVEVERREEEYRLRRESDLNSFEGSTQAQRSDLVKRAGLTKLSNENDRRTRKDPENRLPLAVRRLRLATSCRGLPCLLCSVLS